MALWVKLYIYSQSVRKFCKATYIPFILTKKVKSELQRIEAEGVFSIVCFSNQATPIVVVDKRDSTVRIPGNYKIT